MATARPEQSINNDFLNAQTTGLLLGIQPSTDLNEIIILMKELFDFRKIELYQGINHTEAFFILDKRGKIKIRKNIYSCSNML